MHRGNCKRCGRPRQPDEDDWAHVVCDEFEADEPLLDATELAEKAERIRQYKNKNQSGDTRNAKE